MFLTAAAAITDIDAVNPDITADDIVLIAGTGVGTSADFLGNRRDEPRIRGGTGGVFVANSGALTIGGIGAGGSERDRRRHCRDHDRRNDGNRKRHRHRSDQVTLTAIDAVAAGQNFLLNGSITISSSSPMSR